MKTHNTIFIINHEILPCMLEEKMSKTDTVLYYLNKTNKVLEKMNNYVYKSGQALLLTGAITVFAFASYLVIGQVAVVVLNKSLLNKGARYERIEDVHKDLESQRQLLGLENVVMNISFDDANESAVTHKIDRDHYEIVLGKARNISVLRHEAWHIHEMRTLKITVWNHPVMPWGNITAEWRATSYAIERYEDQNEE